MEKKKRTDRSRQKERLFQQLWMYHCEEYEGSIMMSKSSFFEALNEYANQFKADQWIGVEDDLPTKDQQYNVAYRYMGWHIFTTGWSVSLQRWDYKNADITHWQPLPVEPLTKEL